MSLVLISCSSILWDVHRLYLNDVTLGVFIGLCNIKAYRSTWSNVCTVLAPVLCIVEYENGSIAWRPSFGPAPFYLTCSPIIESADQMCRDTPDHLY